MRSAAKLTPTGFELGMNVAALGTTIYWTGRLVNIGWRLTEADRFCDKFRPPRADDADPDITCRVWRMKDPARPRAHREQTTAEETFSRLSVFFTPHLGWTGLTMRLCSYVLDL